LQEVLKRLEQVQEVDSQINTILRKKAEFPQRLVTFETEIKTLTLRFEEKKKAVDELERNKRQQLGALELNEERAKRSQEKLEQIKTNQEYQALTKEIESLKKNSTVIQETANKVGEDLEKQKTEMATIETALKEVTSKRDAEAAKIAGEESGFDGELSRLKGLRANATTGIDPRYLATYDRVRQTKTGIGIVPATAGSCRGCNMRIPPQIYNELQRGTDLHLCPSCKRILVYKEPPKVGVSV
jgi:predicted  nucleic acid-binding Zn-ribbon protein